MRAKTALWCIATLALCLHAHAQSTSEPVMTLKVETSLVLSDVVVRDKKTGLPIEGLHASDFEVFENGKPQRIASFDEQSVSHALALPATETVTGSGGAAAALGATATKQADALRNHRLIVLFFDLSSLQPDDLTRVQEAARNFVNTQMQAADLVCAVSLGSTLALDQDFTQSRQALLHAIDSYAGGTGNGYSPGATSTTNQVEDTTAYTPDESEFNDLNTDRELFAMAAIAKALGPINQKKSLLYFSGGVQRDGIENEASLRATVNAAVRSNLAIYSVDARGLQAVSPLGDATTGSLRGNAAYSGAALQNNLDANFNTQEVLATLSDDTGGKAFFDSNNFAPAFAQVQNDTAHYYVLGFHSTDTRQDGRYRRLEVRVHLPNAKVSYRQGYYASADYRHATNQQREQMLETALHSDLPETDMPVYLQPFFFRDAGTRYSMPVALLVPGSAIPFGKSGDREKATLDVIGNIKDAQGHVVQDIRDTVKLAVDASQQVTRKNIQYSTGFTLPAGRFHLKFVVRENETGKLGSFETDVTVPDMSKAALKMSSLVLAAQRVAATNKAERGDDPMVYEGQQYVPNLPHVFHSDQPLYLFYEVYDPALFPKAAAGDTAPAAKLAGKMRLLTSIELLRGNVRVFSSPTVAATAINLPKSNAVVFAFTVPLTGLSDGLYTCQVNVIDDAGATFAFPRTAVMVRSGK